MKNKQYLPIILVFGTLAGLLLLLPALHAADAAPADDAGNTTARLQAVCSALEMAASTLHTATTATHGGFVEKGLADLAPAVAAANAAVDYARSNPGIGAQPAPVSTASEATLARIDTAHHPGAKSQPSMYRTLDDLKSVLNTLQSTPGGTLGGKRAPVLPHLKILPVVS